MASATLSARPRVIIMADIGGFEPDDQQSFVRLLLYSNEMDLRGIIGQNSCYAPDRGDSQVFLRIIDAYDTVRPNLLVHAEGWPAADSLRAVVREGQREFIGMLGVGREHDTPGSQLIMEELLRDDPRPLWVLGWGGVNTLAQALWRLRLEQDPATLARCVARLRVYDICGQDDSGAWIANQFPQATYLRSVGQFKAFSFRKDWLGQPQLAGDLTVADIPWFRANVQAVGPLGACYPNVVYAFEGDTPSFLYLVDNGLGDPAHPAYGSWGGRFTAGTVPHAGRCVNEDTRYLPAPMHVDATDAVEYEGAQHSSTFTPLWRWREAYQNDFAARMQWTIQSGFDAANHPPQPVVNGDSTSLPLRLRAPIGGTITLDASASTDPDGQILAPTWWQYVEPGTRGTHVDVLSPDALKTQVKLPAKARPGSEVHIILSLRDTGTPALTRYKRVIVELTQP